MNMSPAPSSLINSLTRAPVERARGPQLGAGARDLHARARKLAHNRPEVSRSSAEQTVERSLGAFLADLGRHHCLSLAEISG